MIIGLIALTGTTPVSMMAPVPELEERWSDE